MVVLKIVAAVADPVLPDEDPLMSDGRGYAQTEAVPQPNILDRLIKIDEAVRLIYERLTEIDGRIDRLESSVGIHVGPVRT